MSDKDVLSNNYIAIFIHAMYQTGICIKQFWWCNVFIYANIYIDIVIIYIDYIYFKLIFALLIKRNVCVCWRKEIVRPWGIKFGTYIFLGGKKGIPQRNFWNFNKKLFNIWDFKVLSAKNKFCIILNTKNLFY